jgi:hypothetical protein
MIESWTLNKSTAERLADFERKSLRRMFGGINVNENWRTRYNRELMQLFGDLYTLWFVRISRLNWIGRVSRMGSKRKASPVHNNSPQGSRVRGQPKKQTVALCVSRC